MTLKEYIEQLNKFVEENPEALDYTVIYAGDDEGNDYNRVCYSPSTGYYEDREFDQESDYPNNAVCIN